MEFDNKILKELFLRKTMKMQLVKPDKKAISAKIRPIDRYALSRKAPDKNGRDISAHSEENKKCILKIKDCIDETASMIFATHMKKLLSEPITYILSAVWGKKHGQLSVSQKEINWELDPLIDEVIMLFEFDEINESQRFALEYLIRGLVISKVTYLIESFKNRSRDAQKIDDPNSNLLDQLEELGTLG